MTNYQTVRSTQRLPVQDRQFAREQSFVRLGRVVHNLALRHSTPAIKYLQQL